MSIISKNDEVEQVIREHVILNNPNSKGWETCVHTSCDHGNKGPRAAFIFADDSITFNCFNCSTATGINLSTSLGLPPKFRNVLSDFGISNQTLDTLAFNLFQRNVTDRSNKEFKNVKSKVKSITPETLSLPKGFDVLDLDSDVAFIKYLEDRKIDPNSYPFMVYRDTGDLRMKKWNKRLIVPFFHNDNIVFYQGRDISHKATPKYLNATDKKLDRNKIISDYEILFDDYNKPLYVTEGWFDAHLLGGVALFGNHIRDEQATWLSRSSREKIYVMDRFGDGQAAALEAVDLGWSVSIPFDKSMDDSIKDVNDLIKKYGRLFTLKLIQQKTYDEFSAKINIELHTK